MLSEIQPLYIHSFGLLLTIQAAFLTSISNACLESFSQVGMQTGGDLFPSKHSAQPPSTLSSRTLV